MIIINNELDFNMTDGLYVVRFSAKWCSPCRSMNPIIEQLESDFNTVSFLYIDVDKAPELARRFNIKTIPALLFIKNGVEINRVIGLSLIEPLRKIIRNASYVSTEAAIYM
jgi:thioredoxin 1